MIDPRFKDAVYSLPLPLLRLAVPSLRIGSTPYTPEVLARQVIFIHVPKAAGSSLKIGLYGTKEGGHRRIVEFSVYDAQKARDFFKCAFVRNPWDRLQSAFSYLRQGVGTTWRDNQFALKYLARHADLRSFLLTLRDDPACRAAVMRYDHFRPQSYWICMPGARQHAMDFLGHYETLEQDRNALYDRLGIRPDPLVRARSSTHRPYTEDYDDETRDIVADLYAEDIALLGYGFEGLPPPKGQAGGQASTA